MDGSPAQPHPNSSIHGSVVAWADAGVLLLGASGSGKSDLALRLIRVPMAGFGLFQLVADDRVCLDVGMENGQSQLLARAAAPLAGLLEVRGVGLLRFSALAVCRLRLVVELVDRERVPRHPALLPESERQIALLGIPLPKVSLCPWDQTAALKVALALESLTGLAAQPAKAHFPC